MDLPFFLSRGLLRRGLLVLLLLAFAAAASPATAQLSKLKKKAREATQQVEETTRGVERTTDTAADTATDTAPSPTAGRTLYVASSGSNRNDGTKGAPFKNLDKAMDEAEPGDRINVAEGVYTGTFDKGYWHTDKPLQLYGGYATDFSSRDPLVHRTVLQPTAAARETSRKRMMVFDGPAGGVVIDGFVFDHTALNTYHGVDGRPEGVASGMLLLPPESFPTGAPTTVTEPCLFIPANRGGGAITVRNNAFVNCAGFAVQGGIRDDGVFLVENNVFVGTRMAALDIAGKCPGEIDRRTGRKVDVACGDVVVANNTFAFTWSRLKDFGDMGNAVQINTKSRYDIHDNIIVFSIGAAITHYRFNPDAFVKVDDNTFFGNKTGDLRYSPDSNTDFHLTADQLEDVEFASVSGNVNELVALPLDPAYVEGFLAARYSEQVDYDENSSANQLRALFGLNKRGTIDSQVSMFANLYPMEQALELFGAVPGRGAQRPSGGIVP